MPAPIKLEGQKFGRLTVLSFVGTNGRDRKYLCRCECGSETITSTACLRSGTTRSCGCLIRISAVARCTTHGASRTRLYWLWADMIARCTKENHHAWENYGGRGIHVCAAWRHDFAQFASDMGSRPPGAQLDRIDNDKGYEPSNCRWSSRTEQANNKRNNRLITHDGRTMTLAQWSRETGIPYHTLKARLGRYGMSPAAALTKEVGRWF